MKQEKAWAEEEFGHAELGDVRRTRRVVQIAAQVAHTPGGKVTQVSRDSATREGSYRLLSNEKVQGAALGQAAAQSAARRSQVHPFVYVPLDGSSLSFVDKQQTKGLGMVGTRTQGGRGLQVVSALSVSPSGRPEGLLGQIYFTRTFTPPIRPHRKRTTEDKETKHTVNLMEQVKEVLRQEAPKTQPWFQIDRGGDAWPVLDASFTSGVWLTVRSSWNRRIVTEQGQRTYLWDAVKQTEVKGTYALVVAAGHARKARTSHMEVRSRAVVIEAQDKRSKRRHWIPLDAVYTKEVGSPPAKEPPIEWMLLTNVKVDSFQTAHAVITGYTKRWRVEEFHKLWKSGACQVETSQLRSASSLTVWAILLASVALRLLRLSYLARTEPEQPAEIELTPWELQAVLQLAFVGKKIPEKAPTIAQAVLWLARLGGYAGHPNKAPPGPLVLARGLAYIEPVARLLEAQRKM